LRSRPVIAAIAVRQIALASKAGSANAAVEAAIDSATASHGCKEAIAALRLIRPSIRTRIGLPRGSPATVRYYTPQMPRRLTWINRESRRRGMFGRVARRSVLGYDP